MHFLTILEQAYEVWIMQNKASSVLVMSGGSLDPGAAGSQYWLCGGALSQIPFTARGAAQLPQD